MSYILDALKQSEGQRKQDAPPQAQPALAFATRKVKPRRSGRLPLAIVLLVGVAVLGWWTLDRGDSAVGTVASPVAMTPVPAETPGVSGGAASTKAAPEMHTGVAEMIVAAIGNDDLKGVRIQLQEPAAAVSPRSRSGTARPDAARESADTGRAAQSQPGASASMQNDVDPYAAVPYRRQLPVDVQRSLPELAFSVHIYSKDPASRRVKIGERMMREGQSITAQVRLEEIIPKGVILSYEDYRFRMSAL
ncbi:general secretion pathway protein GspB [Marinobacterium sedimentorum]|uniref:general secretion pathway protein GspB n=1 Tax=Marinobacterium sedimentorum TaxID=2927804 RepID=UPI0020C68B64|nr:general secretion pathway protein GspB [Marinobacterium sedimentorum]MCP8687231.1 general secretion pathway protein GspB [Marinobacterium sedimentorum]